MRNIGAGPARVPDPHGPRRRLAQLRQAVWEASQDQDTDAIRVYVDAVLDEIESDAP
jgi:hypothetical protein